MACLSLGMLYTLPANAVHDEGVFQLDGDAQTSAQSNPTATDDWDKVCPANSPSSRPASDPVHCLGGTTAQKSTFIPDAFLSASDNIYKGGTDDADVNSWAWKQAGPSPDKDDIEHAYAAQYTVNAHKVLYFGGDRLANNGNTNIGFWFFHNEVSTAGSRSVTTDGVTTCAFSSGCGFSGVHTVGNVSLGGSTPGDIFILSAFTNGGAQPTIKLFEWVGPNNATKNYLGTNNCFTNACTLQPLAIPNTPGFTDNRCGGPTVTGDVGCAVVNGTSQPSPWIFTDKTSGAPANTFGTAELYEGGLDLTDLGFGDACFSSALLNTRSSQSGTSVLQDFALGGFGSCSTTVVTTPSVGSGGAFIGTDGTLTVHDTAAVTVNGISSFTGSLDFHLCGPMANATDNCASGGAAIGAKTGVNPVTTNGNYDSADAVVSRAGRYCWRANFTSTTTGVPAAADPPSDSTSLSECFTVNPRQPTISTVASNSTSAGAQTFGQSIDDTATLSGTANKPGTPIVNPTTAGGPATGTITFRLYGPSDLASGNCIDSGTGANLVATSVVSVLGDGTAYKASDGTITGNGGTLIPPAPGHYWWRARYSGDSPNTLGAPAATGTDTAPFTACDDPTEDSFVQTIPTSITTSQSAYPNDSATVSTTTGTLAGNVEFKLFGPTGGATPQTGLQNCQANTSQGLLFTQTRSIAASSSSPQIRSTSNGDSADAVPDYAATTAGPFYWRVTFTSSDTSHESRQSVCSENTTLTFVNDSTGGSKP